MPRISYRVTKRGGESMRQCAEQARDLFLEDWKPGHWHLEEIQEGFTEAAGNFVRVEFSFLPPGNWRSTDMNRENWGIDDGP